MLTPDYLASFSSEYLGAVDQLNEQIVRDVARRMVKSGKITDSAKWQIKQAQEGGALLEDIVADTGRFTGWSESQVSQMYQDAGITAVKNDSRPLVEAGLADEAKLSGPMSDLLLANARKTSGEISNLTMTTASAGQNMYMEALNEAFMKTQSGAFSYQEALKGAIRKAAVQGSYVYYDSGYRSKLDVAIRQALLTGINQTAATLTEMYSEDMGVEYYETSAHAGARPSHAVWQGQVFKIHGSTPQYPNFAEATGYGTGAGLCGWNCRHSFYPYWPGISKPAYTKEKLEWYNARRFEYNGEKLTDYECSQIQRNYERSIREIKRILCGYDSAMKASRSSADKAYFYEQFQQESVRLKQKEKELKEFCRKTNRAPDNARMQVYAVKDGNGNVVNYGKSTSAKAVWANKKAKK